MDQQDYKKISETNRKPNAGANATISNIRVYVHISQQLSE